MERSLWSLYSSLTFLDELYAAYLADPASVDPSWRALFDSGQTPEQVATAAPAIRAPNGNGASKPNGARGPVFAGNTQVVEPPRTTDAAATMSIWPLVNAYRTRGHLEAQLDPLGMLQREPHPELDPKTYGFSEANFERPLQNTGLYGLPHATLREALTYLRRTYCGSLGVEFMHISSPTKRQWIAQRMEQTLHAELPADMRRAMLRKLAATETFERFMHTKYVGTKRFSLEGSETLIPLLDQVLEHSGQAGIEEVVLGMAHRGRLCVLNQTMGKRPADIFAEFEDVGGETQLGTGDVKYHLGYSKDHVTQGGKQLHLSLAFNPSHLEAVDPVVIGRVRAKQRRRQDYNHERVMALLIHGDAAFAGQGLVSETLNLADLYGYRTGGTVHIVVNNQIGFTTSPQESRSTPYCTDMAKMVEVPIFHVNGEDLDAVARVVRMAIEYRTAFKCDVVIDMFCYRKYGHNEADEPSFTQPLLYQRIQGKTSVYQIYSRRLLEEGVVTQADVDAQQAALDADFEREFTESKARRERHTIDALGGVWRGYLGGADIAVPDVDTSVPMTRLKEIAVKATSLPSGFTLHPRLGRLIETRQAMGRGEKELDWGMGETMAYGSLLWEGTLVRVSGQDSCRGTFSHRHAVFVDYKSELEYAPLAHLHDTQGPFAVYDSPLSEAGVLGFEFGYSLDYPDGLVIWEAQFGDFVNGAQVILDQFVTSSEDKWRRLSGLTLFLPHGFEGQGPEHSSAHMERFLQSASEDNIQVVQPTTPAQMFHMLRRQVTRKLRKPLIVMTPKSLLRHPMATSPLEDLSKGTFQRVILDAHGADPSKVTRIGFCTGKVYYDLVQARELRGDPTIAFVRIEQIYPWRDEEIRNALHHYGKCEQALWIQDEPENMGAWDFVEGRLTRVLGPKIPLRAVTRDSSASPATGSAKAHKVEQERILDAVFPKAAAVAVAAVK